MHFKFQINDFQIKKKPKILNSNIRNINYDFTKRQFSKFNFSVIKGEYSPDVLWYVVTGGSA